MSRLTSILFAVWICCGTAVGDDIRKMVSPKLRDFMMTHPAMSQMLSNVMIDTFRDRTAQLYYFYTEDDAVPTASHYYPDETTVGILLRENLEPADEFICLLYEIINAQGEKQFKKLCDAAVEGSLSRTNFAHEVLLMEYSAAKKTRDALLHADLSKAEIKKSKYYGRFADCPSTFPEFLTYTEKLSLPKRDPVAELEDKYDAIRRARKQEPGN